MASRKAVRAVTGLAVLASGAVLYQRATLSSGLVYLAVAVALFAGATVAVFVLAFRRAHRTIWLVVPALILAGTAVVELTVKQEFGCPWLHGEADLPAVSAPPQETVRAYLDAVVNDDRKTAGRITSPAFLRQEGAYPDSPFCNWREVSDLRIHIPAPAPARDGYREVVSIDLEFDLEQREPITRPDGHTIDGYILGREFPTDRWKIIDRIDIGP
ncbi:hypothetical protein ABGB12_08695 [Actinocorallia sp. B10E7]|uniref:hypothetical protein n=1 Tax=Actinocorallia sp. B10E7 TaxID=3153558 RepID=UPI00325CCCF5